MSKYDKASLVMIPSAYKAEKLYSVLPENGNGDFTHDRNEGTATRVNKDGLIESVAADVPRLDYPLIDGVVQDCPALLLEPATTNFLQYSEDFTQSEWSKTRVNTPVLQTSVIAPDGTTNVHLVTNNETGTSSIFDNEIGSSTNSSTFSVFVKYYNLQYLMLRIDSPTRRVLFDIQNGSIIEKNSDVTGTIKYYGNGWYRCSITHTALTAAGNAIIQLNESGTISDSNVSTTGSGYYIFGAQYEVGSYTTSYIPTSGSTVTRNADVCNSAGTSAEFNDSEGVLYAEFSALANDSTTRVITINDTSNQLTERVQLFILGTSMYGRVTDGGTTQGQVIGTPTLTDNNKIAFKYKANDFALWINGVEVDTSNSGSTPSGLDTIRFDAGTGGSPLYGNLKETAIFKSALTDSELESLTSWDSFNEMATSQLYTIR